MALLEIDGVTKTFGGVVAVRDVSMEVNQGSIVAVIGPNGAGKTSLFNVVTGFESPTSGTIRFDGADITGVEPWQVARRGLVRTFQTPVGFPALSVWENLMVAGTGPGEEGVLSALRGSWRSAEKETRRLAQSLLEDLDLWESRDEIISDLPPGDVKLVDFARQLMTQPRLLLLDEPASGVDPAAIGRLAESIRKVRDGGVTVLVIDHNIGFVLGIADEVNVMALGEVIARGTPEEIVENQRVIEIYLGRSA
ncbi:MAG: ABC transporter ATP-binding protein [Acidimicrobiia bacterium]|nr:ABC transporter ATP-binding protein [Acidimicrobiia bacterium]MDH5292836.1 ABC transporter ATP-binding protein [Acidimicrobiia bacterium]